MLVSSGHAAQPRQALILDLIAYVQGLFAKGQIHRTMHLNNYANNVLTITF